MRANDIQSERAREARAVPPRVLQLLRSGFVQNEAHDLLRSLRQQGGYLPGPETGWGRVW